MFLDPSIPALVKRESVLRYELASNMSENRDVLDIGCGYGSYIISSVRAQGNRY